MTGVMPIEGQVAEAFEVIELERLWDDELKCEINHLQGDCTVEVTHRIRWCDGSALMCQAAAVKKTEERATAGSRCSQCLQSTAIDWKIRPI